MDKRAQNEIKENRARLRPIIETIIFCGKQNIALRGHRDDGNKIEENGIFSANDGNFRALLQYRIQSRDEVLRQHLEKCNKNASYISKTIQNQIISIIGELILKQIIEEVKQAHFYTVLLDETTDISNVEQASLCIRYILNEQIHEKFLMFIPVSDRSGACLANLIINTVLVLGLDLSFCVGQGYDGCSAMSVISDSCEIRSIQNTVGTIKEVYNFVRSSSVRSQIFEELSLEAYNRQTIILNENIKASSLQSSKSENSTIEVRTIETFNSLFPVVVELLTNLMKMKDRESSVRSNLFYGAISSSESLCSLPILNKLLSFTTNVAHILQVIQMKRNEPDEEYKYLFEEAQDLAKYTETIIEMQRVVKRQLLKIDSVNMLKKAAAISCLIPEHIADKSYDDLLPAIELYQNFLHCSTARLKTEFVLWKKRWTDIVTEDSFTSLSSSSGSNPNTVNMKRKEQVFLPDTIIDSYATCSEAFYPNIKVLLKIFATLPVTTATTERSFSVLKLLKTYLRSTMSETRLNGLAMMYIYRNMAVDIDAVIDEFAKSNRRLAF
ncbi:unnamed protein product [Rotaria magnacalcarata]|nr:unnamed protein product [Rotaria magnacalcarata]